MYRELAEEPRPIPRSWWQRQNWACRLGLHALKKKLFELTRRNAKLIESLRWWKRCSGGSYEDRKYARCTRASCNYATVTHFVYLYTNGWDVHKYRLTNENQLPPSLRRKKLLK